MEFIEKFKFYFLGFLVIGNIFAYQMVFDISSQNQLKIYALNVGQGEANLITYKNLNILIDAGPSSKTANLLDRFIPIYNRKLDLVFISHPNSDHYNGMFEILKRYQVRTLILNGVEEDSQSFKDLLSLVSKNNIPIVYGRRGENINFDNLDIFVLWPTNSLSINTKLKSKEINDSSLVLFLDYLDFEALFTGDISSKVENILITDLPNTDFLKVAHHGSKNSTSLSFLEKTKPLIAVIPVGNNSYGFPAEEVLANLEKINSQIFTTLKDKTIQLIIKDNFLKINQINL